VPLQEIARLGIGMLLRRITEQDTAMETIMLPAPLIVRASTSPPRVGHWRGPLIREFVPD